jgi:hypothetical protein
MMLQEQLAQPQTAPVFSFRDAHLFDLGLLGNVRIQAPTISISENFGAGFHARLVVAPIRTESAEIAWLEANARELGQHQGEWLLIQGSELLVHSRDFVVLRTVIREQQIRSPFVYYVPTDEETNSVTI